MKNSGFDDEKSMITYVSCCQEKEDELSFSNTLVKNGDDGRSTSMPRRRRGEKREEGLLKTMMITRPKGGNKYLCMDSEEVKACKELGFELEDDKLKLEFDATLMPSVLSGSASQTSIAASNSSSNADWRIANPGDDPRDVIARLKLWAQAVVQASSSSHRRARG
ncbi:hypothetical protein LIER_27532 [Lithospermum erythrorhizon]|uniref:Uncharacterized protein n=1 Tax=Lithospermum erythrorhizon TaxID=34254 RepID=A0AAV3RCD1_LITER